MLQHLTASRATIIIAVIFLSQTLFGTIFTSKAQNNLSLQDQVYSNLNTILDEQDKSSFQNLSLASLDLSSPEELANQDIYLRIHNSLNNENKDDIYEAVALTTGYSTSVVEGVIEAGVLFAPDFQLEDPDVISQTDIFNQIREVYKQEKEFFTTISKLKQYSFIHEIFTDGDPTNSGFDLISDLNLIEEKLFFQKTIPTFQQNRQNQNNPWPSLLSGSGLTIPTSSISTGSSSISTSNSTQTSETPTSQSSSSQTSPSQDSELQPIPDFQFETIQFGEVCHIDEKIKQEVEIFQEDNSTSQENSSSEDNSLEVNQPESPSVNTNGQTNIPQTSSFQFDQSFLDSSNSCPKDQVFCFTQEIKYNQIDLFYPENISTNQDCVACVVERIGVSLQTLLDQGVLPRKITGNFGEPPLCKKASIGEVGLNLHLIPKPILPDRPNSDLIKDLDSELISNQTQQDNSTSNNPDFSISQDTRIDPTQSLTSQQQQNQVVTSFDNSLQLTSSNQSKIKTQVQNQQVLIDQLNNQISTLNTYFQSLNSTLKEMDSSLQVLINKKECSQL